MEQPNSGWIKVYRSMADNGHLQMPDTTFKLWLFLLLAVNHRAGAGCAPGEGWITYRIIKEACCDPDRPPWADSTINRSLDYLEDKGYIKRIHTKRGGPQRIRIVNWAKYQQESSSILQEAPQEVRQVPLQEAAQEKQEGKEEEKEDASPAARSSSTPGERWQHWWSRKSGAFPSATHESDFQRLQAAGVTDDLIIAVGEKTLAEKLARRGHPLSYMREFVSGLSARGIRTLAAWKADQAEPETAAARPWEKPPASPEDDDYPQPEEYDPIAEMVRAQSEQLRKEAQAKEARDQLPKLPAHLRPKTTDDLRREWERARSTDEAV